MPSPFHTVPAPKTVKLFSIALLPIIFAVVLALMTGGRTGGEAQVVRQEDPIERGEYLVTVLGCHDCHTPFKMGEQGPEPDMTRMLSGHPEDLVMPPPPELEGPWSWVGAATNTAFAGPWGISYAANLTSDEETGIGAWTEEMFVRSLKTGWHKGVENSRIVMPPMPWPWFGRLPEEDLQAIYAYLQAIPPIQNAVPAYVPPPAQPKG